MRLHFSACIFTILALTSALDVRGQSTHWTMRLNVNNRPLEGRLLTTIGEEGFFLCRDGELARFKTAEASSFEKVSASFQPYTPSQLRGKLLQEFGAGYEVSGSGQFVVVHPAGQRDLWAVRLDELYRSFMQYFAVRGFTPRQPEFPLAAVVFPTREEFVRYSTRTGTPIGPGVLGYYSPVTNRILMYDITAGRPDADDWHINAETIIHEAAHQTAFNTGIHNRFAPQPKWLVEGLGTLFEAQGVWNARQYPTQADRINRYRLQGFQRRVAAGRPSGALAEMISGDRLFQTNPEDAYAEAWALMFFLMETEPRKFTDYLRRTASRPAFEAYSAPDRLADFTAVFGANLGMLETRLLRFMAGLK